MVSQTLPTIGVGRLIEKLDDRNPQNLAKVVRTINKMIDKLNEYEKRVGNV